MNRPFDEQSAVDVYHNKLVSWLKSREAELEGKAEYADTHRIGSWVDRKWKYIHKLEECRMVIDQLASIDTNPELE